ncbi:MAG: PAS domain S-box protein [Spirochaetia bacterium]|nr:PAS domain S-box protein [Spirochaetia bacterium]
MKINSLLKADQHIRLIRNEKIPDFSNIRHGDVSEQMILFQIVKSTDGFYDINFPDGGLVVPDIFETSPCLKPSKFFKNLSVDETNRFNEAFKKSSLNLDRFDQTLSSVEHKNSSKLSLRCIAFPQKRSDGSILWNGTLNISAWDSFHQENIIAKTILDTSGVFIIILDENGKIIRFNHFCEQITGYTENEVLGKSPGEFLIDNKNLGKENIFQDILQEENVIHRSDFWIKKNHEKIYVSWTVSLVENDQQSQGSTIITGIDLTRQINAEIQKESFFQLTSDMLCILDLDGNFLELNSAWETILGYSTEELKSSRVFNNIHPDDKGKILDVMLKLRSNDNTSIDFINRYKTKIGHYKWLMWNTVSLSEQKVIYAVAKDITGIKESESELEKHRFNLEKIVAERTMRLKESEERFRRMANDSPALIWMTDAEGNPSWFNKRWLEYTGKDLESEINLTWTDHLHEKDRVAYLEKRNRAHITREKFETEYELRKSDGTWATIADIGIPRFSDYGNFEGFIGYSWDISERKLVENELIRAKEDAEKANQAKSEFLSCMSHELRTPLNAVLGFAQMMELTCKLDEQSMTFTKEIYKSGKHLLELINDLLDLSKIEAGETSIHIEDVNLGQLLEDCIMLMTPIADKNGIEIILDHKDNIHTAVLADKIRLRQVILNLLSNAVKYNIESGKVTIFCEKSSDSKVKVLIHDTGIGIDDDKKDSIFKPFNRVESEQNIVPGAGIGLVIAQKLIILMKGSIGFDSKINTGSTFWIELPSGSESACHVNAFQNGKSNGEIFMSDVKKVLYIEDNPTNLLLIEHVLARISQVEMLSAPNPGLGLELATSKSPDLILLDINLPGMDGYEVLKRLRENDTTSSIPVIAISANAMSGDIDKGKNAGFVDYITKPIDIQNFLDLLSKTLQIKIENFERSAVNFRSIYIQTCK